MNKKAALHNLGCKVNAYEMEAMRRLLVEAGYEIVPFAPGADVYVINTCTVTNIADRKSRQMLHKAKKMNPRAVVVAAGCYSQTSREAVEADPCVDIVLGNNRKGELVEALELYQAAGASGGVYSRITEIEKENSCESLQVEETSERTRASLKVQDGCNQFCSYCIIPYARGRIRSREAEDVCREVETLTGNGCREIVLTGIHLSSYGKDHGSSLQELICRVHEIEGVKRIRLGSLEPGIITREFARAMGSLEKLCPHFHLSLQSGCDATLRRMNRHYTTEEYREKCLLLREIFYEPALTTDVIVGFPGETEEEFGQTAAFLEEIGLYETHIFKYSRRKGTRAASMPDQVPESIKNERSAFLIHLGEKNRAAFEEKHLGREAEVLFEEKISLDGKEYYTGYTKEYIKGALPANQDYTNQCQRGVLGKKIGEHLYLLENH